MKSRFKCTVLFLILNGWVQDIAGKPEARFETSLIPGQYGSGFGRNRLSSPSILHPLGMNVVSTGRDGLIKESFYETSTNDKGGSRYFLEPKIFYPSDKIISENGFNSNIRSQDNLIREETTIKTFSNGGDYNVGKSIEHNYLRYPSRENIAEDLLRDLSFDDFKQTNGMFGYESTQRPYNADSFLRDENIVNKYIYLNDDVIKRESFILPTDFRDVFVPILPTIPIAAVSGRDQETTNKIDVSIKLEKPSCESVKHTNYDTTFKTAEDVLSKPDFDTIKTKTDIYPKNLKKQDELFKYALVLASNKMHSKIHPLRNNHSLSKQNIKITAQNSNNGVNILPVLWEKEEPTILGTENIIMIENIEKITMNESNEPIKENVADNSIIETTKLLDLISKLMETKQQMEIPPMTISNTLHQTLLFDKPTGSVDIIEKNTDESDINKKYLSETQLIIQNNEHKDTVIEHSSSTIVTKENTVDLSSLPESDLEETINTIHEEDLITDEYQPNKEENTIDLPPVTVTTVIDNPNDDNSPITKETIIDLRPLPESDLESVLEENINNIPEEEYFIREDHQPAEEENTIYLPPITVTTVEDNPNDNTPPITKETTIDLPPLPEGDLESVLEEIINNIPEEDLNTEEQPTAEEENTIDLPPITVTTVEDNPNDDTPPVTKETTIDLPPLPEGDLESVLEEIINNIPEEDLITEQHPPAEEENTIDLPPITVTTVEDNPDDDNPPITTETTIDLPPLPESDLESVLDETINNVPDEEEDIITEEHPPTEEENTIDLPPITVTTVEDNPNDDTPPVTKETTIDLPPLPESELESVLDETINNIPDEEEDIITEEHPTAGEENTTDLPPITVTTVEDSPNDDTPPITTETTIDLPPLPESDLESVLEETINKIPEEENLITEEQPPAEEENTTDLPPITITTVEDNPDDDNPPITTETTIDLPPLPESDLESVLEETINNIPEEENLITEEQPPAEEENTTDLPPITVTTVEDNPDDDNPPITKETTIDLPPLPESDLDETINNLPEEENLITEEQPPAEEENTTDLPPITVTTVEDNPDDDNPPITKETTIDLPPLPESDLDETINNLPEEENLITEEQPPAEEENTTDLPPITITTVEDNPDDDNPPITTETTIDLPPLPESDLESVLEETINNNPEDEDLITEEQPPVEEENTTDLPPITITTVEDNPDDDNPPITTETTIDLPPLPESDLESVLEETINNNPEDEDLITEEQPPAEEENTTDLPPITITTVEDNPEDDNPPITTETTIDLPPLPESDLESVLEETINNIPEEENLITEEQPPSEEENTTDLPPITVTTVEDNPDDDNPPTTTETTIDLPPLPESDLESVLEETINNIPEGENLITEEQPPAEEENTTDLPPITITTVEDNPDDDNPPITTETTIDLPPLPESDLESVLEETINNIPEEENLITEEQPPAEEENTTDIPPITVTTVEDNPDDDNPPITKETTIDLPPLPESDLDETINNLPEEENLITEEQPPAEEENTTDLPPITITTVEDNPDDDNPPITTETTIDLPPLPESDLDSVLEETINNNPEDEDLITEEQPPVEEEDTTDLPPITITTVEDNPDDDNPPITTETTIDLPPLPESDLESVLEETINNNSEDEDLITEEQPPAEEENTTDLPPITVTTVEDNPDDDNPPITKETTIDLPPLPESDLESVLEETINKIPEEENLITEGQPPAEEENITDLPPITITTIEDNPDDDNPPITTETTIDLPPLPESDLESVLEETINNIPDEENVITQEQPPSEEENTIDLPPITVTTVEDNPDDDISLILKETTIDLPPVPESELENILEEAVNTIKEDENSNLMVDDVDVKKLLENQMFMESTFQDSTHSLLEKRQKEAFLKELASKFSKNQISNTLSTDGLLVAENFMSGRGTNMAKDVKGKKTVTIKTESVIDDISNDSDDETILLKVKKKNNYDLENLFKNSMSRVDESANVINIEDYLRSNGKTKLSMVEKNGIRKGSNLKKEENLFLQNQVLGFDDDSFSEEEIVTTIITSVDELDEDLLSKLLKSEMDTLESSTSIRRSSDGFEFAEHFDIPYNGRENTFLIEDTDDSLMALEQAMNSKLSRKVKQGGSQHSEGLSLAELSALMNEEEEESIMLMGNSLGGSGGKRTITTTTTITGDGLSDEDFLTSLQQHGFSSYGGMYGGLDELEANAKTSRSGYSSSSSKSSVKPQKTSSYSYTKQEKSGMMDDSDGYLEALKSLGLLDQFSDTSEDFKKTTKVIKRSNSFDNQRKELNSEDIEKIMKMAGA